MKTVTIDDVLSFGSCWEEARERMERINEKYNRQEWTVLDILKLPEALVIANDKLRLVLRKELIDVPILHEFACQCAERALNRVNNPDPRSVAAIAAKRAWLKGEISDDELKTAHDAAYAAAADAYNAAADIAAGWAAYATAHAAAYDAADCAAAAYAAAATADWAAYWAAGWDAMDCADFETERLWQVNTLIKMLGDAPLTKF